MTGVTLAQGGQGGQGGCMAAAVPILSGGDAVKGTKAISALPHTRHSGRACRNPGAMEGWLDELAGHIPVLWMPAIPRQSLPGQAVPA